MCCITVRQAVQSQTNEDEIEVKTETLALKATPMANGYVKAKTGDSTTDAVYQKWYEAVYLPTAAEAVLKVQSAASTVKAVSKDTAAAAKTTAAAKEV